MSRRPTTAAQVCAEPGCRERGLFEYDTQREYREHLQRLAKQPWRCVRHTRADEVLSEENPVRATVLVAGKAKEYPDLTGLFWVPEHGRTGSGFTYGPGFKAFADDFPEGTRLEITARIIPASRAEA